MINNMVSVFHTHNMHYFSLIFQIMKNKAKTPGNKENNENFFFSPLRALRLCVKSKTAKLLFCIIFISTCTFLEAKSPVVTLMESALYKHRHGNISSAIEDLSQAVIASMNPSQKAEILLILAEYLREAGRFAEAKKIYKEIISGSGRNYDEGALFGIVQASLEAGDIEAGKAEWNELVSKFPDGTIVKLCRENHNIFPNMEKILLESPVSAGPDVFANKQIEVLPPLEEATTQTAQIKHNAKQEEQSEPILRDAKGGNIKAEESQQLNRFTIGMDGWYSGLGGQINARDLNLDLFNNANFDKQIQTNFHIAYMFNNRHRLKLFYGRFDHDGTIRQNVTFNKALYIAGSMVSLESTRFDGEYAYILDKQNNSEWKLLGGYTFFTEHLNLTNRGASDLGAWRRKYLVPFIGFGGQEKLNNGTARGAPTYWLDGNIKFLGLSAGDAKARGYSFDINLKFGYDHAKSNSEMEWYGNLGYRHLYINGETSQDSDYIRYSGPIFGLESRF